MSVAALLQNKQESCSLQASLYPITCLKLFSTDVNHILADVLQKKQQAPQMFQYLPVVIDVSSLGDLYSHLEWDKLLLHLKNIDIIPVAVQGLAELQHQEITKLGLAIIRKKPSAQSMSKQKQTARQLQQQKQSLIHHQPIRSGQQVYAKQTDLIVIGPVSCGAELLADGHIHVYGPLRGRALAGTLGNQQCCIFCISLEAELLSIAGNYLLQDQFREHFWQKKVMVTCVDQQLKIEELL